jgi:predicted nuclease of predicted toxin-antitoxin system
VRLLLDQNISPRLCGELADEFPGTLHVRDIGLQAAADDAVWDYVVEHGYAIVTKDADFRQRSFLLGFPPKITWLGLGNCTTTAIERLLLSRAGEIRHFLADPAQAFLALR